MGVFERFTERARQVVILAQQEARLLKSDTITVGHVVMGVINEGEGVGARAFANTGITAETVRARLPVGKTDLGEAQIPFTESAKKALEMALREALSLGHNYIGTEHILLGVLRLGTDVLEDAEAELLGEEVRRLLLGQPKPHEREGRAEGRGRERAERARPAASEDLDDMLTLATTALSTVEGAVWSVKRLLGSNESTEERLRHVILDALLALDAEAEARKDPGFAVAARAILRGHETGGARAGTA